MVSSTRHFRNVPVRDIVRQPHSPTMALVAENQSSFPASDLRPVASRRTVRCVRGRSAICAAAERTRHRIWRNRLIQISIGFVHMWDDRCIIEVPLALEDDVSVSDAASGMRQERRHLPCLREQYTGQKNDTISRERDPGESGAQ